MKNFSLPKEFAENWITVLKSGDYKQGLGGTLLELDYNLGDDGEEDFTNPDLTTCKYCCLGVAAVYKGAGWVDIAGLDLPNEMDNSFNIPEILLSNCEEFEEDDDETRKANLVHILSSLNDGFNLKTYHSFIESYKENELVFTRVPDSKDKIRYSFIEIAEWIENNVEFTIMKETNYADMVTALKKPGKDIAEQLDPVQADLLHMVVGISGEAGELLDAVKKNVMYQKTIDRENVIEELGDLEFYMEGLRQNLSITREETLEANKVKLLTGEKARYKLGVFTNQQAQQRADKNN